MSIEFRIRAHVLLASRHVVEVWRDGVFIATIAPGVEPVSTLHIITKHGIATAEERSSGATPLHTLAVTIRSPQ